LFPAFIEMVDVALESHFQKPASEPKLTGPEEVHEAIKGLKLGKAAGPNRIPNMTLKHFPVSPYLQRGSIYPLLSSGMESRSTELQT
jgi:hypothetical protein